MDLRRLDTVTRLVELSGDDELAVWWPSFLEAHLPEQARSICERKKQRDLHLCRSYSLMMNPSVRGFERLIERFFVVDWPTVKNFQRPPERLSPFQRELFLAFRAYAEPLKKSQLFKILSGFYPKS